MKIVPIPGETTSIAGANVEIIIKLEQP